jgi:hypothetical protein
VLSVTWISKKFCCVEGNEPSAGVEPSELSGLCRIFAAALNPKKAHTKKKMITKIMTIFLIFLNVYCDFINLEPF